MEDQEEIIEGDPNTVLGRVRDIRRKWAVQEDEALAYRLQDEEIAQHYNSNRTRNAIVREDAPRAREAQRQEELQAIEERLRHLSLLQKQAEQDARLAKMIAAKDAETPKVKKPQASPPNNNGVCAAVPPVPPPKPSPPLPQPGSPPSHSEAAKMQQVTCEVITAPPPPILKHSPKRSPLLGAAATKLSPEEPGPGPSRSCLKNGRPKSTSIDPGDENFNEEELRRFLEQKDAEVARQLQEELDRTERDKLLALEVQDRELAKMIHEKEKARYRRAKEKARLKASGESHSQDGTGGSGDGVIAPARTPSRNSTSSLQGEMRPRSTELTPAMAPRIPEKQKSPALGEHIGFRANPKPLPPHPPQEFVAGSHSHFSSSSVTPTSPQHRLEHQIRLPPHHQSTDPVPPYMPIHGYNRSSPKRNK